MRLPTPALFLLLAGCGTATPPKPAPATATSQKGDGAVAVADVPPAEPQPEKPKADDAPIHGQLMGTPFTPNVTHKGVKLIFTAPPDGPERVLTITLPSEQWAGTVAPDAPAGPGTPQIEVFTHPTGKTPETAQFINGYTLVLELAPARDGNRAGRIDLSLPDEAKSRLAGAFTAARPPRGVAERPGDADAPFIEGKVTAPDGGAVTVVAVAALENGLAFEQVTGPAEKPEAGQVLAAEIDANPPRAARYVRTSEQGDRYEFTHLPPGRYLVAARAGRDGPAAWNYVDLAPGGKFDLPFTLDRAKLGAVAVTLPKTATGTVKLIPADAKSGGLVAPDVALAAALNYEQPIQDGRATFATVAPGAYRVTTASGQVGAVTVEPGKPATVELRK